MRTHVHDVHLLGSVPKAHRLRSMFALRRSRSIAATALLRHSSTSARQLLAVGRRPALLHSVQPAFLRRPAALLPRCGCGTRVQQRSLSSSAKDDYYGALGVQRDSSKSDIKKAYYKMAKQYHPDTNSGDPAAAKKFAELTEAYEVLSDDEKRRVYDQYGHAGLDGGPGGPGGFGGFEGGRPMTPEDIFSVFEQAFGGQMGGFSRQRGPARGRDVQVGVSLDLAEAAKGCTKEVRWRSPSAGAKSKEVQFPAGVDSGMNLKLAGQGEDGPGGSGNLYISISVEEHPIFERDGADLHVKVRLSITEAILGAKIVIPTLEGKVSLKVRPAAVGALAVPASRARRSPLLAVPEAAGAAPRALVLRRPSCARALGRALSPLPPVSRVPASRCRRWTAGASWHPIGRSAGDDGPRRASHARERLREPVRPFRRDHTSQAVRAAATAAGRVPSGRGGLFGGHAHAATVRLHRARRRLPTAGDVGALHAMPTRQHATAHAPASLLYDV